MMESNHPSQSESSELLAVSFAFPPLAYPRSGQVARLLKHLRFNTVVVCADEEGARKDPTIEPDAEAHMRARLRIPFPPPGMSDHLIGLKLKKKYHVPWVAHFSDPWTDNPFNHYGRLARRINISLERKVAGAADMLVFTSQETAELVMAKYPRAWQLKARVLPHTFDPSLYPAHTREAERDQLVIRYTGEFYGRRTPAPIVQVLRNILYTNPELLSGVRFELIGPANADALAHSGLEDLPEGLVRIMPAVNYQESLRLAAIADGLLVIDAPAEQSVFLPSKLVDYIGAGRPILGLTPPGAAANLIAELGGWVAAPSDVASMTKAAETFLAFLREDNREHRETWGELKVRKRYEAAVVANSFEEMLREMIG